MKSTVGARLWRCWRVRRYVQVGKDRVVIRRKCICPNDFWIKTRVCGGDNKVKSMVARILRWETDMLSKVSIRQETEKCNGLRV